MKNIIYINWLSKNPVIYSVDVFDVSKGHFIYSTPKLTEY